MSNQFVPTITQKTTEAPVAEKEVKFVAKVIQPVAVVAAPVAEVAKDKVLSVTATAFVPKLPMIVPTPDKEEKTEETA